jgi:outer membrane protein TolC
LALLDILDIDRNLAIVPAATPKATSINLDSNKLRQLAFENRPDYLRSKLEREISQLQLLLAEDDKRWDLSLTTSYSYLRDRSSDVRAGLILSQEFGDLTKERRLERSRVNRLQVENTFNDLNDSIEIQIKDQIREVNLLFSQVGLAQKATILSQQQLDIEREKQRLGRGAGIFELVRLQNELADAKNAELNVTIDYLNALTRLDRTLGTTLDTWQVKVETQ